MMFASCGSKVPSYLNVVDIAGLVKGAHEGQGLGNAFLSHIRACDAVFHMMRECHSLMSSRTLTLVILFNRPIFPALLYFMLDYCRLRRSQNVTFLGVVVAELLQAGLLT